MSASTKSIRPIDPATSDHLKHTRIKPPLTSNYRPEDHVRSLTAQPSLSSIAKSRKGSLGGRSISHSSLPGGKALMTAPRMHSPAPITITKGTLKTSANNRRQAEYYKDRQAIKQARHRTYMLHCENMRILRYREYEENGPSTPNSVDEYGLAGLSKATY